MDSALSPDLEKRRKKGREQQKLPASEIAPWFRRTYRESCCAGIRLIPVRNLFILLLCKKYISAAPFFHIWHRKEYSIPKVRLQALFPVPAFRRHASALSRGAVCAKPVTPRPLRRAACLVFHSTRYPTPKRVRINSESPAASSFLRRRFTFTVSVFSSTKLSVSHSRCISSSRLTT